MYSAKGLFDLRGAHGQGREEVVDGVRGRGDVDVLQAADVGLPGGVRAHVVRRGHVLVRCGDGLLHVGVELADRFSDAGPDELEAVVFALVFVVELPDALIDEHEAGGGEVVLLREADRGVAGGGILGVAEHGLGCGELLADLCRVEVELVCDGEGGVGVARAGAAQLLEVADAVGRENGAFLQDVHVAKQ